MSWGALAWAAKRRVAKASDKLVLLGLAERHNPESGTAYPSIAWLTEFSSLDRKTVIAALDRLEAAGIIKDSGDRKGRTHQVKAYSLLIETVPETEPVPKTEPLKSAVFPEKQSQKRDTDTVREPVTKEASASSVKRASKRETWPAPDGVPEEVWRDFLVSPQRRKAGMSGTAYTGILNNLRELAEHGFPPGKMIALAVERGWKTVKLEWVRNDGQQRTNGMGRHQSSDGLSPTTRAAVAVFGAPTARH